MNLYDERKARFQKLFDNINHSSNDPNIVAGRLASMFGALSTFIAFGGQDVESFLTVLENSVTMEISG